MDTGPVFIASAEGSKIRDIDGNEYIDYVGSWGAMILGHSHSEVVTAVQSAAARGTSFGAPTLSETELAEKIKSAFDSIEKVRLVNSGTEAVMTAVRLARAFTGKNRIIKMAGCYHGHSDSLLVSAGSGIAESGKPGSAGVPASLAALTIVVDYNDVDAVKRAFEKYHGQIAACLVEPVAANMGVVLPEEDYLRTLRCLCDANNALFIFDEVITGFRLCYGGAQNMYDIRPDLTCLGKIAGGGLPLAAIGGADSVMSLLCPEGPVYQAGTLAGNPLATAAANVTLDVLEKDTSCYRRLEQLGQLLQQGLEASAAAAKVPITINRAGSIMSCFFTDTPVRNFHDVQRTNIARFRKFFAAMLNQGIYLAPSAYEAMFISLAHTKEDIEKTIVAAQNSFGMIAE